MLANSNSSTFLGRKRHGPLTPCPPSVTLPFILEYIALGENSPKREEIERRLGRNNVRKLVARFQEDEMNRKWIEESTMGCPGCEIKVEKSRGEFRISSLLVFCRASAGRRARPPVPRVGRGSTPRPGTRKHGAGCSEVE